MSWRARLPAAIRRLIRLLAGHSTARVLRCNLRLRKQRGKRGGDARADRGAGFQVQTVDRGPDLRAIMRGLLHDTRAHVERDQTDSAIPLLSLPKSPPRRPRSP